MGDLNASAEEPQNAQMPPTAFSAYSEKPQESAPFHNQYDFLGPMQRHSQQTQPQHRDLQYPQLSPQAGDSQSFAMHGLAGALPQVMTSGFQQTVNDYGQETHSPLSPASVYHMHQIAQLSAQQIPQSAGSMNAPARLEPSHLFSSSYQGQYAAVPQQKRQQWIPFCPPGQYAGHDPYAYGIRLPYFFHMTHAPMPQSPQTSGTQGMAPDFTPYGRRASEKENVPSFPRGPPRKPKQSGHALWVGNLPPATNVSDLKDHFSRDATLDVESLFLISKSNCAFVNYRSEAACVAAMDRFHDSRFHGVRLVCRLRRGSVNNPAPVLPVSPTTAEPTWPIDTEVTDNVQLSRGPVIVSGSGGPCQQPTTSASREIPEKHSTKVPEKFFIVKSLTLQDLEASVKNGVWATQSHNEETLNRAFEVAESVYLIFSANKSGEFFGYCRMTSPITGTLEVPGQTRQSQSPTTPSDGPRSIPTPATETAPRGRIIDDSARGTIFWEAELSDEDEGGSSPRKAQLEALDGGGGQDWGRPFKIEWISINRVPFYRTRGLRNPWNANREVKIARDGTELEPSVGERLVQMFHRAGHNSSVPQGRPY